MSKRVFSLIMAGVFLLLAGIEAQAQFRDRQATSYDYTGPVLKEEKPGSQSKGLLSDLLGGVEMEMDHSYSMNFTSLGGEYQNVNMYTNTMYFGFSDDLTGRLDISMMHSPFGGSFNQGLYGQGGADAQIFIRNAELNYDIGPNTNVQVRFNQSPNPFGYNGGYGSAYRHHPFYMR